MPRPSFDLHTLGWQSFQDLCLAVARTVLGQTVTAFLDPHDGGRDGAFTGTWTTQKGEDLSGQYVLQCKFTGKPAYNLKLSDVSDEIDKAERLASQGRCDSYILLTNAHFTGNLELALREALKQVGVQHPLILGADWLRQQIQADSGLRALVPRVYGLGDLSQILDSRANDQTRAILDTMRDELETVVVTGAYQDAVAALDQCSFVLLVGSPATGKTTIATQLTMAALDLWEAQTYKLDGPDDLRAHWNPHESHQFFWIDDAFGVTQYDAALVSAWNRCLPMVRSMIKRGSRLVLTSRDYIHARALLELKSRELPALNQAKVVVDVQALTLREKEQILYNHVKLGNQPAIFRHRIREYLPAIASNAAFAPETARRLGSSLFTEGLSLSGKSLERFVEKPQDFLEDTIAELDDDSKAALVLLFMQGGSLDGFLNVPQSSLHALNRLGSDIGGCVAALRAMEGSFVRMNQEATGIEWRFRHPTMSDAVAGYLARRKDLVDILVDGSAPEKLLTQVTCGDVDVENAVVVPHNLFAKVADKLDQALGYSIPSGSVESGHVQDRIATRFLASRSSPDFLSFYTSRRPDLTRALDINYEHLATDPGARLIARMYEYGFLDERQRSDVVSGLVLKAIDEQYCWEMDVAALRDGPIAEIISGPELLGLEKALAEEVIPSIDTEREAWEWSYDGEAADEYMEALQSYCHSAKQFFRDRPDVVSEVETQEMLIESWVDEHLQENPFDDWKADLEREEEVSGDGQRNIFDDIDDDWDPGQGVGE